MIIDSLTRAALSKSTIVPRWLFWVIPRNRTTNAREPGGVWTGMEPFKTYVDGELRTYGGAGGLLAIDPLKFVTGTTIQKQQITLTVLDPQIFVLLREYDPSYAPAQLHLALFDPVTEALVAPPTLVFDGEIDTIEEREDETKSEAVVTLVSQMRNGIRPLYLKQSNAYQILRSPTDTGRKYASIAKDVQVFWGQDSVYPNTKPTPTTTPTGPTHPGLGGSSDD